MYDDVAGVGTDIPDIGCIGTGRHYIEINRCLAKPVRNGEDRQASIPGTGGIACSGGCFLQVDPGASIVSQKKISSAVVGDLPFCRMADLSGILYFGENDTLVAD